jgi:hypothetical protein
MALNFSRCVAVFGSSWSEARPPNITFSPSPLAGCLVALEEVGEPAADTELPEPTRQTVHGARHARGTAAVAARGDARQYS